MSSLDSDDEVKLDDDDASTTTTSTSTSSSSSPPPRRVLYDVFFHEPGWSADADLQSPSSPSAPDVPAHYYEVSEADYLAQRIRSYAHSLTTREQLRRSLVCCTRRRQPPPDPQTQGREEKEADLREGLNDDSATATGGGIHWPLYLSGSGHLLAVLTDSALILRTALTQFAFADVVRVSIPPYIHSRSPYPSSQPSSHLFSSPLHPYSYIHSRPAAWFGDSLLAVAVRDDGVNVYDVDPLTLDHNSSPRTSVRLILHFALSSAQFPLEQSGGVGLLVGRGPKQWPTIAAITWREAACHRTVEGKCPHLLVLTYDGGVHHVHVPTQPPPLAALSSASSSPSPTPSRVAFDARVPPHAPPTSDRAHSRSSSIVTPKRPSPAGQEVSATSLNAVIRKRFELQHTRAASSSPPSSSPPDTDDMRGEVATFSGIPLRHGNVVASASSAEDGKDEADDAQRLSNAGGVRRRKQPRDTPSQDSSTSSEPPPDDSVAVAFTAMAFNSHTSTLIVASISLSPDRSPQLSYWTVRDSSPQPFLHRFTTPYMPPSISHVPVPRLNPFSKALHSVWKRVKVTVGASSPPDDGVKPYEPTLSDLTSSLLLAPAGRRVLLLDVQGNINVWEADGDGPEAKAHLIHTVRRAKTDGPRGDLLCQVSWWDDDDLVQGYTDGRLILTPITRTSSASPSLSIAPAVPAPPPVNLLGQVEVVAGIPFLSPTIPAETFTPPFRSLPTLELPHRVFILSCHRRFQRQRRVWAHLDRPEETDALYDTEVISMQSTFRLLSLCESSPAKFLHRKVELHQWEDAMQVADLYDLDPDEVWKERWKAAEVNADSIQQLLARVKDRWWVLHQCATRSCDAVDNRRQLLDYGLTLTSFQAVTELSPSVTSQAFSSAMPARAGEGAVDEEVDTSALDALQLTGEQVRMCLYRLLFVQYVQRLETFHILQHSSAHHDTSVYPLSAMPYTAFLTCDLTAAACDLARDENFQALEALLRLHARELFTHRLDIVDEVPLTCEPALYQQLLPLSTTLPPTSDERTGVWVFQAKVLQQLAAVDVTQTPLSTQHVKWLLQQDENVSCYRPDVAALTAWYLRRAQRTDVETGDLQRVSSLCSLVAEKDSAIGEGLQAYRMALEDVSVLVYAYDMDVSVAEWEHMDSMQRLRRVLKDSSEDTAVHDVLTKGGVVLQRSGDASAQRLLVRFLCDCVRTDLRLVRGLVNGASSQLSSLIPTDAAFVDEVISSLYSSPRHDGDSLRVIESILSALPVRADVQDKRDLLQQHLTADLILDRHLVGQPLSFFKSLQIERTAAEGVGEKMKAECVQLFHHLCRKAIHVKPPLSDKQWSELLSDLLTLRGLVFPFISLESCYTQCVESMLAAGRFKLGKRALRQLTGLEKRDDRQKAAGADTAKGRGAPLSSVASTFGPSLATSVQHVGLLPLPVAEELVLQVAREFLLSSASVDHPSLALANECLHILPLQALTDSLLPAFLTSASSNATSLSSPDVTARWQQELDFIEGLSRLSALNVSIIPIQLRTSSSRLSFISHLLDHNPQAYRNDEAVMDIARLFGCASDEAQAEGRLLLLKAAMKAGDVDKAYQMCLGLLEERRFKATCDSALEVAQMDGVRDNRAARIRLISNATWACDIDRLQAVLEQWKAATVKPLDVATFLSAWEAEAKTRAARVSTGEEKEVQEAEEEEEWEGTGTEVDRLILRVVQQKLPPPPPSSAPSLLAYTLLPSKPAPATIDAVLLAQVEPTYRTDAALALSYLLTLSSPAPAYKWVQGLLAGPLSRSSRAALVSLAFRYSALLTLAAPHPFPLPEQLNVVVADAQLLDVSEDLLQQQVDAISQLYHHSSPSSPPPDVLTRALHYAGLRAEALKADEVLAQFPGLDLERFTRDAQYRYDTILSLVQSPNAEQMSIALPLATRYGLSTTTVYIERLKWLLRSPLSLQAVETEVQAWTPQLMTSPRETYAALDALYPLIDGRDLERFRFLVGLADGCLQAFHTMTKERPVASSPRKAAVDHSIRVATDQLKTHRQVLVLLIRAHLKVDYHRLLDRAQVEAVVSEVVEEPNVLMLQGLADRLNQLIAAPSPLPPFPALPTPSTPTGAPPPPLSPSLSVHPAYVTAALIWRQFLSKSLKRCLSSPSASLEEWFDTEPPTPLRTGTRFRQLSLIDACQLLIQAASLHDAPPPFTTERLIRHLTLVELGLRALPAASPTAAAADADRGYDAVIGLQEKLRVLVSASQLPSLVSTSSFDELCRGSQWRETIGALMLRGQEAGVQVKDVKELIDILDSQRAMQADSYRQPPPASRWSVDSLASELLEEELSRLSEWEQMPSIKARVPSWAALLSPAWLCALHLEDGERSGALRRLHSLLVNYWTQPLPAEAMSGAASSMPFLLLVKALSQGEHHSLPPPLRESLRADRASLDAAIVRRHRQLLERLLPSAVLAAGEDAECTDAQRAAVKAFYAQAEVAAPLATAHSVFASFNVCAPLVALWELEALHGGPTRTAAQWKALFSLLIAFDHPSLLLDVWRRRVNAALDDEEQRQLCKEAAAAPSQALQTAALVLGFSSRHLSIREDATSAALDRPSAAAEKDSTLLTAIATSDQLASFARSSLYPGLSALLLQHSRASPPSPTATAMAAALHRLLGCTECEKRLLASSVVVDDWWLAEGWSLALSLAYLVRKGFHSEAVSLLFSHLQTVTALRTQDVGLELLKHELTDAAKKARKEGSRGGGASAAAVLLYDEALQCMEEAQLVKPVSRAQGQQRIAQPVNPSKASRR